MKRNKYSWIVFDVGAVLIEIDLEAPVRALAGKTGIEAGKIKDFFSENFHVQGSPWSHESYQTGKINTAQYLELLGNYLEKRVNKEELKEAIYLVLKEEKLDVLKILEELSESYSIACFSNTTPLHWEKLKTYCKFFKKLKMECTSFGFGEVKPRPQSYLKLLEALKTTADQVIFIDDSIRNVQGAEKLGMAGIRFVSAADLRQQLSARFQIL
jgi:HAD superfamily hydrolase (TIGR01509 family)